MKKENEVQFAEYGISYENSRSYRVTRPFYLKTCDGPLMLVKKGSIVRLGKDTGDEMFTSNKIIPLQLATLFEVTRPFQIVKDEEYVNLEKGDVVKLSEDEAVEFLRKGMVKEKKGGVE